MLANYWTVTDYVICAYRPSQPSWNVDKPGYYSGLTKTFSNDLNLINYHSEEEYPEILDVIISTQPHPCIGNYTYDHEYIFNSI